MIISYILRYFGVFFLVPKNTREEYQFLYDEILTHLIQDTEKIVKRSIKKDFSQKKIVGYKTEIFKRTYVSHSIGEDLLLQLHHPEKYPKLTRKLRQNKLKKIIENGN